MKAPILKKSAKTAEATEKPVKLTPKKIVSKKAAMKTSMKRTVSKTAEARTKKVAKPLSSRPRSSEAKDRFSEYIRAVEMKKSRFEILSRGKTIAILGPIGSIPKGIQVKDSVAMSEYAQGKRTFSNVVHHGPFILMRNNVEVAVLYPPQPTEASRLQNILDELEELKVLESAKNKMATDLEKQKLNLQAEADIFKERLEKEKQQFVIVRRKAEHMARECVNVLRSQGNLSEASRFESELNGIGRNSGCC